METLEIIKSLCKEHGIALSKLEKILGYGNASLSKAKVIPSDRILEIAKYFDVSMEYLMTGEEKEEPTIYYTNKETADFAQKLFEDDKVLFDVYRSSDKERLVEYAKRLKALRDMEENL